MQIDRYSCQRNRYKMSGLKVFFKNDRVMDEPAWFFHGMIIFLGLGGWDKAVHITDHSDPRGHAV